MCFCSMWICIFSVFYSHVPGPASSGVREGWRRGREAAYCWVSVCVCLCVCMWSWDRFWEMDDCKTARPACMWTNDITNSLLRALPRKIGWSCPCWWLVPPKLNFIPPLALPLSNLKKLVEICTQKLGRETPKTGCSEALIF